MSRQLDSPVTGLNRKSSHYGRLRIYLLHNEMKQVQRREKTSLSLSCFFQTLPSAKSSNLSGQSSLFSLLHQYSSVSFSLYSRVPIIFMLYLLKLYHLFFILFSLYLSVLEVSIVVSSSSLTLLSAVSRLLHELIKNIFHFFYTVFDF